MTLSIPPGVDANGRRNFIFVPTDSLSVAVLGGSSYALEHVGMDAPVVTDTNVISFSGHELAIATRNDVRNPSEVAFLCEMELVTVVPRQRLESIELLGVSLP